MKENVINMDRTRPRMMAVGDNCLDVYVEARSLAVGGNAFNVTASWALLGMDAEFVGAIGDDRSGEIVCEQATGLGIDLTHLHTVPGRTGMTLISLIDGDRQLLHEDFGVGLDFQPSVSVLAEAASSDWVHCISMPNQPSAVRALVDAGARVSVDLSTYHDLRSLDGVEIAFASVPGLAGADQLARAMVEAGSALAVVLCGADGSVAATETEAWQQPAMRIDVVDTCGAGDSFIARFTAARATGSGVPDALSAATEWAAQTCTHLGGFPQELRVIPAWMIEDYASEQWFTSRLSDAVPMNAGDAS